MRAPKSSLLLTGPAPPWGYGPDVPTVVTAALVRQWADRALHALGQAREEIDALNVFPVPDGDTGTNLFLTLEAADHEAARADEAGAPVAEVCTALARGALMGARGNSGVIMSQIVRGITEVIAEQPDGGALTGQAVADCLTRAADLSYAAVAHPVEGTVLSVARAAAQAADACASASARDVATAAVEGAQEALARTPDHLPALRDAGVVDAGGAGLVVILRALEETLSGVHRHEPLPRPTVTAPVEGHAPREDYTGPAYEVMFLLDSSDDAVAVLRTELDALGDSLVVVGGEGLWNVHVHVDDAGAAIEAALRAGHPSRLRITHLGSPVRSSERQGRAVVAVTHGPGVADMLRRAGVHVVPTAPRARPSIGELLEAVLATRAAQVVLLPSDADVQPAAQAAAQEARASGVRVVVIPTRSVVQTLAAVAVHDADALFDSDSVAMTRAAGATRYAAITVASRSALTMAGPCAPGDVLGVSGGDIVAIGADLGTVARDLLDGMLASGGELVTLVVGADADDALRDSVINWLAERHPLVDVDVLDGGQALWPLIMGVE